MKEQQIYIQILKDIKHNENGRKTYQSHIQ